MKNVNLTNVKLIIMKDEYRSQKLIKMLTILRQI